jgi:phage shock protein A
MHHLLMRSLRRRVRLCRKGNSQAVLTPQARSDAEELFRLVSSAAPGDESWRVDALSIVIDFALCLSWHLPGDEAAEYYEFAVRQMIPLLCTDPGRVRRVFWSQIRRIISDELESSLDDDGIMASAAIRERLLLLEWFIEQDKSSGGLDAATLSLVGWARWRRFEIIVGDEHMLELDPAAEAFEALEREWQAGAPAQIRDYLDHLRQHVSQVSMFSDAKLVLSSEKLSAVGRAVLQLRRNLAWAAPDARARAAVDLCHCLLMRYGAVHLRDDLDEAVERLSALMTGVMADDLFADAARAFGLGLVFRGDLDGTETDLTRGVETIVSAWLKIGTVRPATGQLLSELMLAACTHARRTKTPTAIDRVLEITNLQDYGEPNRVSEVAYIRMLLLSERFKVTGMVADLDGAVAEGHRATSAIPRGDPTAAERWHWLARVEHDRFGASKDIADLNAAIKDIRVPLRYMETPDPALEEELALWQTQRFQLLGDQEDIRDAERTLIKLWDDENFRPDLMFNVISIGLRAASYPPEGVRAAVEMCRVMIGQESSAGGPSKRRWLNLLSKAIHAITKDARTEHELALSIQAAGMAVQIGADDDDYDALVYDLVVALIDRGLREDLDRAIREVQRALGRSRDWTQEFLLLSALAAANLKRFELIGENTDQLAGIDAFRRIATNSGCQAQLRGDAAYLWAEEATKRQDYPDACQAYQITVQLIVEQARRPGRPEQRNAWLARWTASARNGAACAIRAGRPDIALALLEHGRAVNVSQSLQRQADIAAVRPLRPDLAKRMSQLAQQIEEFAKKDQAEIYRDYMFATFSLISQNIDSGAPADFEEALDWVGEDITRVQKWSEELLEEATSNDSRLTLSLQWDQLMGELHRQLPNLPISVPPAIDNLIKVVSGGAAVVLNVSKIGCDALIIKDATLRILPLPDLTETAVHQMFRQLYTSIFRIEFGDRSAQARAELHDAMFSCLSCLWDWVCAPVLKALSIDGPPNDGEAWPRIWWCPTGHLAMLPIHAAGHYDPDGQGPCAIDRVISSYTTTLTALARARHAADTDPDPGRSRRLRAISVPEIDGAPALRYTDLELAAVSPWIPAQRPPLVGDQVTIDSVYSSLHEYDWLHIACHGTPPIPNKQPAQLYLSNNVLTVNRVAWETAVNSELAYLSGCHTAAGSFTDPDEAEHMAGAFQATGYQHVIGTLWGAADRTAAAVASDFYHALATDKGSGPPRVASALHQAIRACKHAHPKQPFLWAPFVHLGP